MSEHQAVTEYQSSEPRPSQRPCVRAQNALNVAERSFKLLITGPSPLSVDGRRLGHGLPARRIDLGELRALLLESSTTDARKDAVWADLVARARTGDPAWVIGCVGVAMPGLKRVAERVIRSSPARYADDIVSELITEFVAQLARIDTRRPNIAPRLLLWARKGALRARGAEVRHVPCDPAEMPSSSTPSGEPDPMALVLEAVRQGIITPASATLIIATRLDGMSVRDVAQRQGASIDRLFRQRRAAEARLAAALRDGRVTASPAGSPSEQAR